MCAIGKRRAADRDPARDLRSAAPTPRPCLGVRRAGMWWPQLMLTSAAVTMADVLRTRQRFRYQCHTNTDAAGGHDIELPWVSAIQNESDCRAACDRLSNCSAFVVGNQTVVRGALEKCRLWRWLSGICGRLLLLLPTDTCWLLAADAHAPRSARMARRTGSAVAAG
eukprot:COSAG01_NODE_25040_length_757_cov_3.056231_1_plen_167_part_00